jgi:hypothetical protein
MPISAKRLSEARRDVEHGLAITLDYFRTRVEQEPLQKQRRDSPYRSGHSHHRWIPTPLMICSRRRFE